MFYLKIAFLNIFRNLRRTTITLCTIVFGSIGLIVFGGFINAIYDGLRETMIRQGLGHIQFYESGYSENYSVEPENYLMSSEKIEKIRSIAMELNGVDAVTERLNFSGLLSNGSASIGVLGKGINSEEEAALTAGIKILKGEGLFPEDTDGALLGDGLAKSLNVVPGDTITLLVNTIDGVINAADVQIVGIVQTGFQEIDQRLVQVNLPYIRDLMYTDKATRLVVLLDDTARTDQVIQYFNNRLKEEGITYEIKSWSDLADFYHKVVVLFNFIFNFINIVVSFLVILSIVNTMLMSVLERTSEIGSIRAIGSSRSGIIFLLLTESFYLGVIGGVLGIFFGIGASELITSSNLMMPAPPGRSSGFPVTIFIVEHVLVNTFILSILSAVISGVYPAIKASRLKIVDALRHV